MNVDKWQQQECLEDRNNNYHHHKTVNRQGGREMKVRFYCDIPPNYNPQSNCPLYLNATSCNITYKRPNGFTRIAFDVDFPPELITPLFDKQAPMTTAMIINKEAGK